VIQWTLQAARLGQEDEHIEIVGVDFMSNRLIRAPMFFEESQTGEGWSERLNLRYDAYELPCACGTTPCQWHESLVREWREEDEDAIDSWRETRADFDAMMRRTERKIRRQVEEEPDVLG
jgi:hypothetical protein